MSNETLPYHLAIVMDGNGRWAKKNRLTRLEGHKKGADTAIKIVKHAAHRSIKYLTLYTFSSENWLRPIDEVSGLMEILYRYLLKESESLKKNNVKLRTIGDLSRLPPRLLRLLVEVQEKTSSCDGLCLTLALSYGSRDEIVRACKKIAQSVQKGEISPEHIDENLFSHHLDTNNLPDPDLIIRTSGEVRLSNFLLWQSSYSELFFRDEYWPEFTSEAFDEILSQYAERNRRYGKIS